MSVHRFPGPAPDMAALDAALSKRTGYYRQAAEVRQRVRAHQAAKNGATVQAGRAVGAVAPRHSSEAEPMLAGGDTRSRALRASRRPAASVVWARFGGWALLAAGVALGLLIAISICYFLLLLPRGVQVGLGLGTGASLLAVAALRSFEAL